MCLLAAVTLPASYKIFVDREVLKTKEVLQLCSVVMTALTGMFVVSTTLDLTLAYTFAIPLAVFYNLGSVGVYFWENKFTRITLA